MTALGGGRDRPGPIALAVDRLAAERGGRAVLQDVSLQFARGSITVVVGPSGVGKTTFVNVLNGLVAPSRGSVTVAGIGRLTDAKTLREARRSTATVFQDHALIGRLPAIDNVLLGLADTRHPLSLMPWPGEARKRAAEALFEVGLLGCATRRTATLSGGERQRVGIARALIRRPRILLGDEPFASVDPVLAAQLSDQLRRLAVQNGLTVILVLHQLSLARQLADRIVGFNGGRVVFDGPATAFDAAAEAGVFATRSPVEDGEPHATPDEKDATCCVD